jgi:hypothetical protein
MSKGAWLSPCTLLWVESDLTPHRLSTWEHQEQICFTSVSLLPYLRHIKRLNADLTRRFTGKKLGFKKG